MQSFLNILNISRNSLNNMPVLGRSTKTGEEFGEFCETVLHNQGLLPHKTMKEPVVGEAADVIMCVLDTLAGCYPEMSILDISNMLEKQFELKSEKWLSVMVQNKPIKPEPPPGRCVTDYGRQIWPIPL